MARADELWCSFPGRVRSLPFSNEGFHASHSTASIALADVLGRYIQLIASTAGDYAATTGRTTVGLMDAVEALDELGVRLDDLDDFAAEARGRGHIGDTKQLRGTSLCEDRLDVLLGG